MFRKWLVGGLALAAVTAVAIAQSGRTILVDDFNDGDSEGWAETDFTGGLGSFDASSGAYVLSTEVLSVFDLSAGTLDADWEPSEDNYQYANGTVRGQITANTDGTTVGLLMRDSHELEADYGFYGSAGFGTFYIEYFNFSENPEAPQQILAMADPDEHPFEVGVTYNLEAGVVGSLLWMKAWKVGDPEPVAPMLLVIDDQLSPDDGTGIAALAFFDAVPLIDSGVLEVEVNATIDNITFTRGRDH